MVRYLKNLSLIFLFCLTNNIGCAQRTSWTTQVEQLDNEMAVLRSFIEQRLSQQNTQIGLVNLSEQATPYLAALGGFAVGIGLVFLLKRLKSAPTGFLWGPKT